MNRIMLDLETLGTQAGCVVATIGAVRFTGTEITDELYLRLDIRAQQKAGLHVDADTVLWWLKREDAARAELTASPRMEPLIALRTITEWMQREGKLDELWGNGADFDCVILAALYRHLGEELPWRYHRNRCYRTMCSLHPEIKIERSGEHHNALDDARSQARHLMRIGQAPTETTQTPLEQWAHKAAQELATHTTLVDWYSGSKRLEEVQIAGNDAIAYEWAHFHRQVDEGRAAGERMQMLFDEYRKLTDRSA